MKAIQIKYLGATNTKPSRFVASTEAGRLTKAYDYGFEAHQNAYALAQEYCDKYGWGKVYGFGKLENGNYVATLKEK